MDKKINYYEILNSKEMTVEKFGDSLDNLVELAAPLHCEGIYYFSEGSTYAYIAFGGTVSSEEMKEILNSLLKEAGFDKAIIIPSNGEIEFDLDCG